MAREATFWVSSGAGGRGEEDVVGLALTDVDDVIDWTREAGTAVDELETILETLGCVWRL